MATTSAFKTALLNLYFLNTDHSNVGDAAGLQNSAAAGTYYVSLHTADPGETGTQTTSEATYTSYARVAVARTAGGWTVSGDNASNTAPIAFPMCTGGSNTITDLGIGSASSGTGNLFFKAPLTAPCAVSSGIIPTFGAGDLDVAVLPIAGGGGDVGSPIGLLLALTKAS